ncbi:MAG TPA: hypothetical protein VF169_12905 [Albitalea sp.]|uniref:hypothetical protein n=1 Tax=Piscinibacter sp. TaxID=1903157 RepID=UPI002ED09412
MRRICALLCAALLAGGAAAAQGDASGELRARWDARDANPQGPLAGADARVPGIAPATPSAAVAEAELRGRWRALSADLLLSATRDEGGGTRSLARFNEFHASGDFGAWQLSAGKKIVGWDVGYGFRPNDVVQQEERRTLLSLTPEGRPLLQLEHFGATTAASLVWVNPQRWHDPDDAQRFARESALAARGYLRAGAADWHLFGRVGQHTGASVGAALAWVATESLELHASARLLQRHDGWAFDAAAGDAPVRANPWRVQTLGGASQWLVGANWTGAAQQSVIVEWWHDGTALSDGAWDAWSARNAALAAGAAPPVALAGNLAWQASPLGATSLRRDNLFVRLAWQPEHWLITLDALVTPADRGRVVTAEVQWQGDRVRVNAAWRVMEGPSDAVVVKLPLRHSGLLALTWAF